MTDNGKIPSPRTCHCGGSYRNQLIIFGGGEHGKNAINDRNVYIYNAISHKWASLAINGFESPQVRQGHVLLSNEEDQNEKLIYLHGGLNGEQIFDDLWTLDLKNFVWKQIEIVCGIKPSARASHGGVYINGLLFIFGGLSLNGTALDDLWKFNISNTFY